MSDVTVRTSKTSYDTDSVSRIYRAFVVKYTEKLTDEEIFQVAYIWLKDEINISGFKPSTEKKASKLELFTILECRGFFGVSDLTGLLEISRSINRMDLVKEVEDFMKKKNKPKKKEGKKKRKASTSDEKKLEQTYETMILQSMRQEACIRDLRKILRESDYTVEACIKVVQQSEDLAQDYVSEMSQARSDLVGSRTSSITSLSSDSSTDSHRRKLSDEIKPLSTLPEQAVSPSEDDGYEPVIARNTLLDNDKTPKNSPARFRQQSQTGKPTPKPRSPASKRRTISIPSEESKENSSSFSTGKTSSPYLSGNRLFTPSPLTVRVMNKREEEEKEEDDKTGDSGMGTGSGSYENREEWKSAITNPPPIEEKTGSTEYAGLVDHTKDPEHLYKNIQY